MTRRACLPGKAPLPIPIRTQYCPPRTASSSPFSVASGVSRIIILRRAFEKLRKIRKLEPTHVGCYGEVASGVSRITILCRAFEKLRKIRKLEPTHVGCYGMVARTSLRIGVARAGLPQVRHRSNTSLTLASWMAISVYSFFAVWCSTPDVRGIQPVTVLAGFQIAENIHHARFQQTPKRVGQDRDPQLATAGIAARQTNRYLCRRGQSGRCRRQRARRESSGDKAAAIGRLPLERPVRLRDVVFHGDSLFALRGKQLTGFEHWQLCAFGARTFLSASSFWSAPKRTGMSALRITFQVAPLRVEVTFS